MEFSGCARAAIARRLEKRGTPPEGLRGLSKLNSLVSRPRGVGMGAGVDVFQASPKDRTARPPRERGAIQTVRGAHGEQELVAAIPRKEVIQPQLPLRLPCYDFTPITDSTFGRCLPCGLAHGLRAFPAFVV